MSYRSTNQPPSSFTLQIPGFTRAVKILLIVTISVWVCQWLAMGGLPPFTLIPFQYFSLIPIAVLHGWLFQLVTYLFLHEGWMHLFWNMFALWMFGVAVEGSLGSRRFYWLYFISGIGAGVFDVFLHAVLHQSLTIPTVGASGAIYGVLLAFGMMFPDQPVFLVLPPVSIKAKWLVLGYGVLEFLFTLGPSDHVSHFAHLGGMLFGFLYMRSMTPFAGFQEGLQRWKRRRQMRKFEVYMSKRDRHDHWTH